MENNDYNDIGLFKFRLIAPAINKTHGFACNEQYFKNLSTTPSQATELE